MNKEIFKKKFYKLIIAAVIMGAFATILMPFILSILLAGLLAMVFSPFLRYLKNKGLGRRTSTFILTFLIFLLGFIPLGLIILRGVNIISSILAGPNLVYRKDIYIYKLYEAVDKFALKINYDNELVREKFENTVLVISKWVLNLFSKFISQIPNISMMGFITILAFYYFLLNEKKIRRWFNLNFYFTKTNLDKFIKILSSACKEVFFSNVITGILQATLISTGAYICIETDFYIVFIITFFLSFIPTGAAPVGLVLAIIAFLENKVVPGIADDSL